MRNLLILLVLTIACTVPKPEKTSTMTIEKKPDAVYVGSYTRKEGHVDGKSDGILLMSKDEEGRLRSEKIVDEVINPSYLTTARDGQFLLAVSEIGPDDGVSGEIKAYKVNKDQSLTLMNTQPTDGFYPCHVSADKEGQFAFVANYVGGTVKMFAIEPWGSIKSKDVQKLAGSGPHARQEAPHLHMTRLSPDEQYLFVPDLGTDRIWNFKVDRENAKLVANESQPYLELAPGSGPRHLDFHPGGQRAFIINELNSTITVLDYDSMAGSFTVGESTLTIPEGFDEFNGTADIHVHPNGKFIYGSNRGHDSIVIMSFDQETGTLTQIGLEGTRGGFPRNFSLDAAGQYLYVANQNSDNIVQFKIDQSTGMLAFVEEVVDVMTPVCIDM
ncbi:MAG: lactonase family protein [Cyclobacteriaceae bacterium]